jgi:uncharacterized protein Yka (UPF0111/DUF47 family)
MLKRFFPKQPNFFEQLSQMASICQKVAKEMEKFANESYDSTATAKVITDLEHDADALFRSSLQLLTDTFITPIEREHLHSLFLTMDDIVDSVHLVSQRVSIYKLPTLTEGTREMIQMSVSCIEHLQQLILKIDSIKEPTELHRLSREINKTASRVTVKMQHALLALYDSGAPMPSILKERDVIFVIQAVTVAAEKVTVVMEEILLDRT